MRNYKRGDIVVMNKDHGIGCYEDELLTYIKPADSQAFSVLRNIHGIDIVVPNDSFDLRDKPEFEIDEMIEVSNQEDFSNSVEGEFLFDYRTSKTDVGEGPFLANHPKFGATNFSLRA